MAPGFLQAADKVSRPYKSQETGNHKGDGTPQGHLPYSLQKRRCVLVGCTNISFDEV